MDTKGHIVKAISSAVKLPESEIEAIIEKPKIESMGDYAFPCFMLAKTLKKAPHVIASDVVKHIKKDSVIDRVEAVGAYVNFFVSASKTLIPVLDRVSKEKSKYGSNNNDKSKIIVEFSSPNIAKPFGIGHLRSTIIGNSIAKIAEFNGAKVTRINYLGDWGTQFGKLMLGFEKWGSETKLKKDPISHLLELYVKANDEKYEKEGREWFRKLEEGDKKAIDLWKKFRELSLKDFQNIYDMLGVKFDVISGESYFGEKGEKIAKELEKKKLLEDSQGASIVNLEDYGLGVCLIKKSDGATLYITRDIAAAIERQEKFKFDKMFYEVGNEQSLHFKQLFKVLELMGNKWAKECRHIEHGLYLAPDGKKFSTRKGKTVFMKEVLEETLELAKEELVKRGVKGKELDRRALAIARAAIFYGDLKNYRAMNMVFDLEKFLSFEGDTGPYLLYSYARAKSILEKATKKKMEVKEMNEQERALLTQIAAFPEIVEKAYEELAPSVIAHYSYSLAQKFNEFYHASPVIGSQEEAFRVKLVESFAQVLKNSLELLGIDTLEEM